MSTASRAQAAGCKTGTAAYERAQFGADLGLTLGGGATSLTGRFAVLQARRDPWDLAIDRRVPVNGSIGAEIASDVLMWGSMAVASAWAISVSVRCAPKYTLGRSVATPLFELSWAFLWTYGLGELTKSFSGRPRPYTQGDKGFTGDDDDYRAFFSGHTSVSTVMMTTTVASGLRWAEARWTRPGARVGIAAASGLTYGLTTGVMRILAAKHHPSDILVGATVGLGVGLSTVAAESIGRFAERHRGSPTPVTVTPWPAGRGAVLRAAF